MNFPELSVPDRVELRRQLRNLENFLNFDFKDHKKLSLLQDKVHGHAIEILKEIDWQHLKWQEYPTIWWKDGLNLKNISEYILELIPSWEEFLKNDPQKLVLLEKQCALFERLVAEHDKKQEKSEKPEKPISFINPFKKVLRIVSSYPFFLGHSFKTQAVQEIIYDRLTTAAQLATLVEDAKNKPVLVQIMGSESVTSNEPLSIHFTAVPKDLFKSVVQVNQELFDPTDGKIRDKEMTFHISYDDFDTNVLYGMLFKAGEKQSLSHVYEQGFTAGKIIGHAEALQKIHAIFSGKASETMKK